MINNKVKKEIFLRDKERCILTGTKNVERTPHHCFFLSEYFEDDKNESWNLITIGVEPHRLIHFASNDEEVKLGKEYAKKCRQIAFDRYKGKHKDKLIKAIKSRYGSKWRRKN